MTRFSIVLLFLITLAFSEARKPTPALGTLPWLEFSGNATTNDVLAQSTGSDVAQPLTYGQDTPIHQHPYMVTILIDSNGRLYHICGGVLVTRKRVLTAAHCTDFMDDYDHYVGLGVYDLTLGLANTGSQLIKVRRYHKHHRYLDDAYLGFPNDIAMLDLSKKATLNQVVKRAKLARPSQESFAGDDCTISGWGTTEFGRPSKLQSAYQLALTRHVCRKLWKVIPFTRINRRHICSMFYPVTFCDGDTGGPLTCGDRVVGIASWGDTSCGGCVPAVYSRVSAFTNWILRKI